MPLRLKRIKNSTWIRLALGLAIVVIGMIALWHSPVRRLATVEQMTNGVDKIRSAGWAAYFFYVVYAIGIMALPITPFPIFGGVLFDFWIAFPLNLLAATAGAYFSFLLTRFFGRDAVHALIKGKLERYDQLASARGLKTVLLIRWLGVPPFIVVNYAMGLSGIKSSDYLLGTFLGISPWIGVITYASQSIWKALVEGGKEGYKEAITHALIPLVVLSIFVLVGFWISLYFKKRNAAAGKSL